MMTFIGKAVASAVIGKVVEKLASILEVSCFKGKELNDESRQKLRIVLLAAKAVLIDVEAKQISNPALKEWVRELTDAVYVAEALLDKIDTEIRTSRCQPTAESQTRKRKYSDFISSFVDLFVKGSGSELQNILQKLEYMTQQQKDVVLGLIEVVARDNEERENSDSEETNSDNEETDNSDNEERENSDSEETNSDNEETENSDDEETENSDSEETNCDNEEREKSDSEETDSEFSLWLLKYPEDGENSDSAETDF